MSDNDVITSKVKRLIRAQRHLLYLMRNNLDFETLKVIDESFYMEKVEELNFMLHQIAQISDRLHLFNVKLSEEYEAGFHRWRKDARWLNKKIVLSGQGELARGSGPTT